MTQVAGTCSRRLSLADSQWAQRHRNVLITGPTGVGKSFIACALANKACRDGYTVLYQRTPRLLGELALARSGGQVGHFVQPRAAGLDCLGRLDRLRSERWTRFVGMRTP